MASIIDGKQTAETIAENIGKAVAGLNFQPGLAVVIVGEDPASQVYVRNKGRKATQCGFKSVQHALEADTSEQDLLKLISDLNADDSIHGILVQLPLPGHINADAVIQAIDPAKDVDGFHYENVGKLATGAIDKALVSCTPFGCLYLIKQVLGDNLRGKEAVVIGRSNIVGKPMAQLLLSESCTVRIAHSGTKDLAKHVSEADILVAAVGIPNFVPGDWIKEGACVIDVGINRVDLEDGKTRLVGDVDYAAAFQRAGSITPVPGGVGPMTIAMLMMNTLKAACQAKGVDVPVV